MVFREVVQVQYPSAKVAGYCVGDLCGEKMAVLRDDVGDVFF